MLSISNRLRALRIRVAGKSHIEFVAEKAISALRDSGISANIAGGLAVQEHGYPRTTIDVDLIVPDRDRARLVLIRTGFRKRPGSSMTVSDPITHVEIDLLESGSKLDPGPLPIPEVVNAPGPLPILPLPMLVQMKLSTYIGRGVDRLKDAADVVELIKANSLPREYKLHPDVVDKYTELWDGISH